MESLFSELASMHQILPGRFEHLAAIIATAMVLPWACGINLYATVFTLGLMGASDIIDLPEQLQLLEDSLIITCSGVMYLIEYLMSRGSRGDSDWDHLHNFIYIPVGGLMAAACVASFGDIAMICIGIAGAMFAYLTHASALGAKHYIFDHSMLMSATSESMFKDIVLIGGLWTGFNFPLLLITLLIGFAIYIYS